MPFQKQIPDIPVEARPIVPQSGRGQAVAQAIQNIGEIAGQTVQDIQTTKVRTGIQDISQATTVAAAVKAEGGISVFNTQGDVDVSGLSPQLQQQVTAIQAKAGDRFKRIAQGVAQGAIPRQAAALEAEAAIKELINQTPGFGAEIRQQARDLLGYDPTGFALRQTLDLDTPRTTRLTASQKRLEEAQSIVSAIKSVNPEAGISVETVMGNMAVRDLNKINQELAAADLDLNTISFNQYVQRVFVQRGPDLADTLAGIATQGAEGGLETPEQYVNLIVSQREADLRELRQTATVKGGINMSDLTAAEDQVNRMYEPLLNAVKNNNLGDIMKNRLDTIGQLNKVYAHQMTPILSFVASAYGDQIGGKLLDMLSGLADPKQFELLYQFEPGLKRLIDTGTLSQKDAAKNTFDYVNKILQGIPLEQEDLKYRHMAETMMVQPGNAELREEYVTKLGDSGAPVRAVSILSAKVPRAVATENEVGFFKRQFNQHIGLQAQEDLPGNLVDHIAREVMDFKEGQLTEEIHINDQGKIVVTLPLWDGAVPSDFQTPAMNKIQSYLNAVQKGWGIDFLVDKDTFGTEIVNRVNQRMGLIDKREEERKQIPPAATGKVERDDNDADKLSPIEDGVYQDDAGSIFQVTNGKIERID